MIPYIVFFILILFLSFKITEGKFKMIDFMFIGIIILFSALRGVGVDYGLYQNLYNAITPDSIVTSRTGGGFWYIMILLHNTFNADYQILIILISILTNLFIYYYIKKNSQHPGRTMLIYICLGFYTTSFNMFRQMLSISFILIGSHMLDKSKIKAILLYLIAFSIHSSAIIGILGYFILSRFKKININPIFVFLIAMGVLLMYNQVFSNILSLLPEYNMYLKYDSTPGIGTYLIVSIFVIIYLFFLLPNKEELIKINEKNRLFFALSTIGVGIMLLELKNYLFFRIAFYFTIYIIFLISDYYSLKKIEKNRPLSLIFYMVVFAYFLIYVSSFDGVMPYKLYF